MAANFPDGINTAGPRPAKLTKQPLEFPAALIDRNEDGGADVNVFPCGLRAYVLEYEGITEAHKDLLIAHYNDARGKVETFNFYDRDSLALLSNCKYREFKVGRHRRTWSNVVSLTIIRFE